MIRIPGLSQFQLALGESMIQFLVSWGPMLLLIAVWIFLMKKGGALSYKQHVAEMKQLAEAQLAEMKRMNEVLGRIESSLGQNRSSHTGGANAVDSATV
jgi:hypothetical protein